MVPSAILHLTTRLGTIDPLTRQRIFIFVINMLWHGMAGVQCVRKYPNGHFFGTTKAKSKDKEILRGGGFLCYSDKILGESGPLPASEDAQTSPQNTCGQEKTTTASLWGVWQWGLAAGASVVRRVGRGLIENLDLGDQEHPWRLNQRDGKYVIGEIN